MPGCGRHLVCRLSVFAVVCRLGAETARFQANTNRLYLLRGAQRKIGVAVILPIVLGVLALGALYKVSTTKKVDIDEQSTKIFNSALMHLEDPDKLKQLASIFRKVGFDTQANVLDLRASLFMTPAHVASQYETVFKQALMSLKPDSVLSVASYLEGKGAFGAAQELRKYAQGLITALTQPLPASPVAGASVATTPQTFAPTSAASAQPKHDEMGVPPANAPAPISTAASSATPAVPAAVVETIASIAKQAASTASTVSGENDVGTTTVGSVQTFATEDADAESDEPS